MEINKILLCLGLVLFIHACSNESKTTQFPIIVDIRSSAGVNNASIVWTTNEPTSGRVEYGLDSNFGMSQDSQTRKTRHSVQLHGLSPGFQYFFRVVVEDADNNEVSSSVRNFTTETVPLENNVPVMDPPGNHSVEAGGGLVIVLTGSDPDPQTNLQYAINNIPQGATFNNDTFNWQPDTGQVGVHLLEFTVSDGAYVQPYESIITVIDPLANTPSDPTGLSVVSSDVDHVELSWSASTDDTGIKQYRIYRDGQLIHALDTNMADPSMLGYIDSTVSANRRYRYNVSAVDIDDNESGRSNNLDVSTFDANMVSFWDFAQGRGSIVPSQILNQWSDASNDTGSLIYNTNSAIPWTLGYRDFCIQFPGLSQAAESVFVDFKALEIPPAVELTQMSIAAWLYVDEATQDARIISKANGVAEQDHYWMLSTHQPVVGGDLHIRFRLKTGGVTSTLFGGNIPLNSWTHVAATYNGTNMMIYVNGSEVGTLGKTGNVDQGIGVPVTVGINPVGGRPLKGRIDELRLYNRSLLPGEITALVNENP